MSRNEANNKLNICVKTFYIHLFSLQSTGLILPLRPIPPLISLHEDGSTSKNPFIARINRLQGGKEDVRMTSKRSQIHRAFIYIRLSA